MIIKTIGDFRRAIRNGPYAWPGGYPCYFVMSDGEALSYDAAKTERRNILFSLKYRLNDGWRVISFEINYEDGDLICCHTYKRIESAYAEK